VLPLRTLIAGSLALVTACGAHHADPAAKPAQPPVAPGRVVTYTHDTLRLRVEALRDDLVHFELAPANAPSTAAIPTSIMIAQPRAPIAWVRHDGPILETRELKVEVDPETLCVKVTDLTRDFLLHRACPDRATNALTISKEGTQNLYGLGEQFQTPGAADGDWMGRERTPGNSEGNAMVKFDGGPKGTGSVGNAQFPVLYALGAAEHAYAMFFDDPYAERWSFQHDPWTVSSIGDQLRWYVIAGADVRDLRRDYMDLVGHALVPPKKAFGLWISEYGFDDWKELEGKLATLRAHHFPVDGFVLDLQWFGNVTPKSETSRMGTLSWDTAHFPDPARKIKQLADEQGIGIMPIEESYVARGLPEHADLAKRGFLARDGEHGAPSFISANPWWGVGGMIDWSNRAGADYWHDTKRQPLVDAGVLGHWCDLGEPEMYLPGSWYAAGAEGGHRQIDVHNLFSLIWVESIARGYARHHVERRPFMMSRSGAPGIQRYGASMWSGDIGSNLTTLATHMNAQMQMSLSGIDYFGSDIGGFIRDALRGDLNETYTQWFADGMAVDVPGRVHTWNTENDRETAPDRVGHMPSNLANVRRRYELVPYVYSLAHRAFSDGEPVFPPLVWAFPGDPDARTLGSEKLIGEDLLVALVAKDGAKTIDVYLPKGATWIDFDGRTRHEGGQWLRGLPLRDGAGVLRLPMFARAGAIVPMAYVDDHTWNVMGKRDDGTQHDELRVRVFAGGDHSAFTLVEDDGETIAYQRGQLRRTRIEQKTDEHATTVTIGAASGTYANAPARRDVVVDVVLAAGARPDSIMLDGQPLTMQAQPAACDQPITGWCALADGRYRIRTGEGDVAAGHTIVVTASAKTP
jgi:alpha-glucosidase (family GH31 glycosyl hydrolase)